MIPHPTAYRAMAQAPASPTMAVRPPKRAGALSSQATGTRRCSGREQVRIKSMPPNLPRTWDETLGRGLDRPLNPRIYWAFAQKLGTISSSPARLAGAQSWLTSYFLPGHARRDGTRSRLAMHLLAHQPDALSVRL